MVTDGGASTKTSVLLWGGKGWEGACSVSESLITLYHLNPLSADLVPGSEARAHTCVLLKVSGPGSDLNAPDSHFTTAVTVGYFITLCYRETVVDYLLFLEGVLHPFIYFKSLLKRN